MIAAIVESGFHMIAAIADLFFSAIAAITAIIWKPSLTVTNPWKDLQQARREAGRFTRMKGLHRSFLGYLGLSLHQLCTRSILSFFVEFFAANAWLRRAIQPNFTFYREHKQKKTNFTLSLSLPLDILVYEVFVFERVRLHLAELANRNNRPEVSRRPIDCCFLFYALPRIIANAMNSAWHLVDLLLPYRNMTRILHNCELTRGITFLIQWKIIFKCLQGLTGTNR